MLSIFQEPKYYTDHERGLCNRTTHEPIPADEPLFIFRAKDRKAVAALKAYLLECENTDHRAVIKSRIIDFETFAGTHPDRMKEPDSSLQDLANASVGRQPYAK